MLGFLKKMFAGKAQPDSRGSDAEMQAFLRNTVFTAAQVQQAIELSLLGMQEGPSVDFETHVRVMAIKGIGPELSRRVLNLLPIVAGRWAMHELQLAPKLAEHYVLHHRHGGSSNVPMPQCAVTQLINQRVQAQPDLKLGLGMGSCEMLALNDAMNRAGPEPDIAKIEILAPEMGGELLTIS